MSETNLDPKLFDDIIESGGFSGGQAPQAFEPQAYSAYAPEPSNVGGLYAQDSVAAAPQPITQPLPQPNFFERITTPTNPSNPYSAPLVGALQTAANFFPEGRAAGQANQQLYANNAQQELQQQQLQRQHRLDDQNALLKGLDLATQGLKFQGPMRKAYFNILRKQSNRLTGSDDTELLDMLEKSDEEQGLQIAEALKQYSKEQGLGLSDLPGIAQNPELFLKLSDLTLKNQKQKQEAEKIKALREAVKDDPETSSSGPSAQPLPLTPAPAPGSTLGVPPGSQGVPQLKPATYLQTPEGQQVQRFVQARARQYGVDPAIAQALIHQESGWNPTAKSPTGVEGLAQVTKQTGLAYGQDPNQRTNPYASADAGLKYLGELIRKNGGDVDKALMQYNGGSDPNYVQNVRRHLPLYDRTSTQTVADQANDEEAAVLRFHKSKLAELSKKITKLGPESVDPDIARVVNQFQEERKYHQAEITRIENLYDKNKPSESIQKAALRLGFQKPWAQLKPEQKQAAADLAPEIEAEDAAKKAAAEQKATQQGKKELAEAANANQIVKDVHEYRFEDGTPIPVGWTMADIRKAQAEGKKIRQVKDLTKNKDEDEAATNRVEFITNLQELADNYGTITTGPAAGRLERYKQMLGIDVKDEVVAQRLLLEKILSDKAFERGGKALTKNEIDRIIAELPRDIDETVVFKSKLNKALQLAHRYHERRLGALEEHGYFIPSVYRVSPPKLAETPAPAAESAPATPAPTPPTASGKKTNPMLEIIQQELQRREQLRQRK